MGVLYRYNYIRDTLSIPKILSFRLNVQITEELYKQFLVLLDENAAPATTFISQLYLKKTQDSFYLIITVNLSSFYEKWSKYPYEFDYKDIVYFLRKKIKRYLGQDFAENYIIHENLDCDFIEYSFISSDERIVTGMWECKANENQLSKLYWDNYLLAYNKKLENNNNISFFTGIEEDYRDGDNELYVRCYASPLKKFFYELEKTDYVSKNGILLRYLYDENLRRTICQYAYEDNCLRYNPDLKKLYEEFCKEFGNPLTSIIDEDYDALD